MSVSSLRGICIFFSGDVIAKRVSEIKYYMERKKSNLKWTQVVKDM